jgi:hypothetical protein
VTAFQLENCKTWILLQIRQEFIFSQICQFKFAPPSPVMGPLILFESNSLNPKPLAATTNRLR